MDFRESLERVLPQEEIPSLLSALEEEMLHCVYVNPKKSSDEAFLTRYPHCKKHPFVEHAFYYDKKEYDLGKSLDYDLGALSIQDASAMMVPYLLNPQPGEILLDLCAAPGGKTLLSSMLMQDEGLILANDVSFPRAKNLSQNVERMGRGNIIVNSSDFSFAAPYFPETFDKIILDAPCSGSAMFRKNEQAKEEWSMAKVLKYAKTQKELLELGASMLKKGGTLSYSTCSFSYEENEGVILPFLAAHPEFRAVPCRVDDPSFFHDPKLKEGIHFFPHRFPGEGQFVVLLRKEGELVPSRLESKPNSLTRRYAAFLEQYGLQNRANIETRGKFYSLTLPFDTTHLNTLRLGVKLFEMREIYLPDHALARYLDGVYSLPLEKTQAMAYLRGEAFPYPGKDGFVIFSYRGMNLGWAKLVKGVAKNHYPKGLRHRYEQE